MLLEEPVRARPLTPSLISRLWCLRSWTLNCARRHQKRVAKMSCSPRPGGNGTLDDEKSPGAADMIRGQPVQIIEKSAEAEEIEGDL
jgi:hypothetical protein